MIKDEMGLLLLNLNYTRSLVFEAGLLKQEKYETNKMQVLLVCNKISFEYKSRYLNFLIES